MKDYIYSQRTFTSSMRTSGTNDAPVFEFSQDTMPKNTSLVKIESASIPISFYSFANLTFKIYEDGAGTDITITLNGNYSQLDFLSTLGTLLTNRSAAVGASRTYTATIDSATNKITISSTGTFIVSSLGTANSLIGYQSPEVLIGASQTADSVLNLAGSNVIYINSTEITGLILNSRASANTEYGRPILTSVPLDKNAYNVLSYKNVIDDSEYICSGGSLPVISFFLTDENQTRLSLNGCPFTITLGFYRRLE